MKYLFYCLDSENKKLSDVYINPKFLSEEWQPSSLNIVPAGVPWMPFSVWWIMHNLYIFANRDYGLYLIYDNNNLLVHRSIFTPRYFRFPFMAKNDLQIGDIWTAPTTRGKGLATHAIQKILKLYQKPKRKFWYVVEENNIHSIKLAEKVGFIKIGEGIRKKSMGIKILGTFKIQKYF